MARKEKQPVHHVQMTDGKRAIIQQLLREYDICEAPASAECAPADRRYTVRN